VTEVEIRYARMARTRFADAPRPVPVCPSASQPRRCCKQQSSSRAAGDRVAGIGHMGPRDRPTNCAYEHTPRTTSPRLVVGAETVARSVACCRRPGDRLVADPIVSSEPIRSENAIVSILRFARKVTGLG
jgi:hypothetical protein